MANLSSGYLLNTAFGHYSFSANTSGSYNAAFGYFALNLNTTGNLNTGVGYFSLYNNTTGTFNSGAGGYSLVDNTTGTANSAFGMGSLGDNVTGSTNAAIGVNALGSAISGYANTGIGSYALTGLTTGNDNVAVGDGAGDDFGASSLSITSATQNIYLGASSKSFQDADVNEIVIGAYATGNGSNTITLGNTNIVTTILQGNVHLGGSVSTPSNSGASITFPDGTVQATAWNGTTLGGDYAESVDVAGNRLAYEAGDVITIDPERPGRFTKSYAPYSRLVAGVFSTKPGLVGRRTTAVRPNKSAEVPLAMMGIVPVKVTTENGPINPGDLLVSSSTPGYAMRGTDHERLTGAVIGKAMESLGSGMKLIEVLLNFH